MPSMLSDADALLDAIWANPDDDTPRLVYADWLEEHDEIEYAQFIRLDCEIARREVMPVPERKTLRHRRYALWVAIEKRWANRLAGLPLSYHGFTRGILHAQPTVDAITFINRSRLWWPLLPIRDLTLFNTEGHEAALAACAYLTRLRSLEIGDVGWHDRHAPASPISEAVLWEIARSPLLDRLEALAIGPVHANTPAVEALAAAPFIGRLGGDAFLLRVRRSANPYDDEYVRGHPGMSAREALLHYLQQSGSELVREEG